jgi:hypothetical protein
MTNLFWNGSQLNNQGGGGGISQTDLTSTVIGLGTVGYISTAGGGGGISQTDLTSTVIGLGTVGYVSTPGANDLFSTLITSTLQTAHIQNTSEYLFMDAPITIFGTPDFTSFYPIGVSSIGFGGGAEIIQDATNNLVVNAPITIFGTPDLSTSYPITVSSLFMGGGELTTDTTNNLFWNTSQINSQYGFVTLTSGNLNVRTYDANLTSTSIIQVTPYGDLSDSGNVTNVFWISIDVGNLEWSVNIQNSLANNVDFSYNILQY